MLRLSLHLGEITIFLKCDCQFEYCEAQLGTDPAIYLVTVFKLTETTYAVHYNYITRTRCSLHEVQRMLEKENDR